MHIEKNKPKGIKIKILNIFFILLECFFGLMVLLSFIFVSANYRKLFDSVNDYTECNKAISEFRRGCDTLTNAIRSFVVNEDPNYLNVYLDEAFTYCHREQSLEILELSHLDDEPDTNLKLALNKSNSLLEIELYAGKLAWLAMHKESAKMPERLEKVILSDEDLELSDSRKLEKATGLLFNTNYSSYKTTINKYINAAGTALINDSLAVQDVQGSVISHLFVIFRISLCCLLVVSLIYLFIIVFIVINPINGHTQRIEKGEKMDVVGAYETRYIANAYNSLLDKNEIKASILKHKAEHDFLTGLINREAFDHIKQIISDSTESIAYLIIDIDFFKQINDNFGHDTGDVVLKKIATLLSEQFRNTDYVARIGGDEFAVLMTKIGETPETVIQKKITNLNTVLQNLQDGLPSVSLSVGVSISDNGYNVAMEKQADEALYRVKKGGRCNCSFYKY